MVVAGEAVGQAPDRVAAGGPPDPAALGAKIRRRLGPAPQARDWPLVSLVVLNRDGVDHLRRLLTGLQERTDYPNFELILVDNASSDDSLAFARGFQASFPISILANPHNESFSVACNQGAELAAGKLLLFLNNDTEPFEPGWLRELVACLRESGAGAVGPTLLEPVDDPASEARLGYAVGQRGLRVRYSGGWPAPAYRDRHADPLGEGLGVDTKALGLIAACFLIARGSFEAVGGFTPGYWYGPEDVDLALKLREHGLTLVCSGRSQLIHLPNSTLRKIDREQRRAWLRGNRRLFMERWGPRLRREYELDRLRGGGLWVEPGDAGAPPTEISRSELEALGFCLLAAEPASEPLGALCTALRQRGHRCLLGSGEGIDDLVALDYDVAVHVRGPFRHVLVPAQLNVLWAASHFEALTAIECGRYDLIVSTEPAILERLGREGLPAERLAALSGNGGAPALAAGLTAAVEARAAEIGFRTRVGPAAGPAR